MDKHLTRELPVDRPYTKLEAMFSLSVDIDNESEGSIKGYSKLWGWSRNKVRKFISEVRTPEGHLVDTRGTLNGHPLHFIDKGLWKQKDTQGTLGGHPKDTQPTPTTNPNPNPKKKKSNKYSKFKPDWFPEKDWNDVIEHRKQKKAALTERAFNLFISEIEVAKKLGYSVTQCVDVMVSKGWRGFNAKWMENSKDEIKQDNQLHDPEYEAARQKLVDQGLL
jgi:hypothetical protein